MFEPVKELSFQVVMTSPVRVMFRIILQSLQVENS